MSHVLIVVDMQKDFVDGSLGTKEAVKIVDAVAKEICSQKYDTVFVTKDTHEVNYLNTFEGKHLPVSHCIRDTAGWMLDQVVQEALQNRPYKVIEKPTFGSFALLQEITNLRPDEITLIGLCTDICVISNALLLRTAFYNTPIHVIADCCAGVTPEKHKAALEVMRSCQIDVEE